MTAAEAELAIIVGLVALALAFDFINGFHDAANSIATVVSTRVLSPGQAVAWAAFFNFVAAAVFGTGVAKTMGSGLIDLAVVSYPVIGAGLFGAIVPTREPVIPQTDQSFGRQNDDQNGHDPDDQCMMFPVS